MRRQTHGHGFHRRLLILVSLLLCALSGAFAQALDDEALAKKAQNPVANIISIPIEYWSYDAEAGSLDTAIAKPVIPTRLGSFNLINRFIVPYAWVDAGVGGDLPIGPGSSIGITPPPVNVSGLADVTYQGFVSPAEILRNFKGHSSTLAC